MADGPRLESGLLHGRGPHAEPLRSWPRINWSSDLRDKEKSFKEQILAELEEANRLRKQHDLELRQKEKEAEEFARRTAELTAEYEAEDRRGRQEAKIREEKRRLEEKAKTALAENQIETKIDNPFSAVQVRSWNFSVTLYGSNGLSSVFNPSFSHCS